LLNLRRSAVRIAVAIGVFALAGVLEILVRPDAPVDSAVPLWLLLVATAVTMLLWKAIGLRWTFVPEDEPLITAEEIVVDTLSCNPFEEGPSLVQSPPVLAVIRFDGASIGASIRVGIAAAAATAPNTSIYQFVS